ncbi:hypothetical protein BUALT_Bualt02G0249300 [Buddleja alternifolia]|uniref:Meiosis-specific protein ASY3-like coiled-coil domain-containing protein n=1 Tax=Buddleja alternifolia TaxID=168488 RepID=A0AAV6YDR8_9LAMI|nr:hypothetical protein BUALT_Bualt02G0249300 [Buddleja alternifolia]
MDVDRQTNLPEERMSDCRSFSSNYRCCSQSRKISIGVLVDSSAKAETKDIKVAVMQVAENGTPSKGHSVKDHEGHSPCGEKLVKVSQKVTSPWVSTRSFNPKTSSSVAVHDAERTPSFPATRKICPRSKLSEKASAAHSVKFFAGKTDVESDEGRQKNFGKATYSMEAGNVNNVDLVKNLVFSNEPGFVLEKEQVEDEDRETETGGRETLRMKLWEILGNVSSPNKHCPGSQPVKFHPDEERDVKHPPIDKRNPSSDTIESDSERSNHTSRRPMTRSLSRKKANTKNQHIKIEAKRSTCRKNACPGKRIFSLKGDRFGRFYDNDNDGSLPSKRKKIERESSGVETCQRRKYENAERQQSDNKSRSIPAVDKSMVHRNKVDHANSSNDRRSDVFVEPKSSSKKNNSFQSPLNVMAEQQKDVQQTRDVEIPKLKDQQEDIANSSLKKKWNSVHDPPPSHTFEIMPPGCLPTNKRRNHDQSPSEEILNTKGIRSFKSFLSSKSTECKPNVQVKSSDGKGEINDCHFMKPSFIMEEDSENRMSNSSTDETSSESSEDDSHVKGGRESKLLSPEIYIAKQILSSSNIIHGNKKGVEVTGCSPMSASLKGSEDSSELQMCLEQNHEDGLASAVALFTVALDRVKTKLKSMTSKRSAEILRAAAEEIFLQLQNAESQIKTDVGKLSNHSQSKRKRLETRLQEQQEQLLGIYKRFKEAVDQHLQEYGSIVEDLEVHEIELKRTVERRRAAHKVFLSQVEQEIKVQLDDAESRIMAVQELAQEKMLQLKLVVAECIKHGAFG